jgi:hypothetical protein
LNSGDDFYIINSGLVVIETTIENFNPTLYADYLSPSTLMEWLRNIVANRLATNGQTWSDIFSRYNSGTYVSGNRWKKRKKKGVNMDYDCVVSN